jgi:hypothetical protein
VLRVVLKTGNALICLLISCTEQLVLSKAPRKSKSTTNQVPLKVNELNLPIGECREMHFREMHNTPIMLNDQDQLVQ